MALTLATALAKLQIRLNDAGAAYWTAAVLQEFINDEYRDILAAAKCLYSSQSINTVNGTAAYALTYVFEPIAVYHAGLKLTPVKQEDMDKEQKNWRAATAGIPTHWMMDTGKQIRLYPTPNAAAAGTANLIVYGYATVADVTSGGFDGLPDAYESLPLEGAYARAMESRPNPLYAELAKLAWKRKAAKMVELIKVMEGQGRA